MKHVVFFSGGVGSFAAAERVIERHGPHDVTLLFTDTKVEDPDLYRFLIEGAATLFRVPMPRDLVARARALHDEDAIRREELLPGLAADANAAIPGLAWVMDGRSIWQVFRENRFLGNTRVDLCSRILKRETADRWLATNADPADTILYVGIDWTEEHRFTRMRDRKADAGWRVEAPLCEEPFVMKDAMLARLDELGIEQPRLYRMGFAHNNCGGGCVKAGQGHFKLLLERMPEVYEMWENNEQEMRELLGKDVSILRDRSGGETRPLTLAQLRRRVQGGEEVDPYEIGGCGCFLDDNSCAIPAVAA